MVHNEEARERHSSGVLAVKVWVSEVRQGLSGLQVRWIWMLQTPACAEEERRERKIPQKRRMKVFIEFETQGKKYKFSS